MIHRPPHTLYLSLGENCLPDNILRRHRLKSFSTIYSHGRSNIDYAIHIENEEHRNLLRREFLYYDFSGPVKVVRNSHYSVSSEFFSPPHKNGFEFTHHDVLNDVVARNNIHQKIHKLNYYRGKSNIKFFYHYRNCNQEFLEELVGKAEKFSAFYESNDKTCEIIIFLQKLVGRDQDRGVEQIRYSDRTRAFIFKTLKVWEGENPKQFFALEDDDLVQRMFAQA